MLQPLPQPKKNWAIDVLTTDFLISGYIDGERFYRAFVFFGGDFSSLALASARIQPTGNLAVPEALSAPWTVIYGETLVAIIPRDQASLDHVTKANADYKYAQLAEVYAGPYLLRGTLLSAGADVRTFAAYTTGFAMQSATISSLLPGARLSGLAAPYVMVVGQHGQVVRPLA